MLPHNNYNDVQLRKIDLVHCASLPGQSAQLSPSLLPLIATVTAAKNKAASGFATICEVRCFLLRFNVIPLDFATEGKSKELKKTNKKKHHH